MRDVPQTVAEARTHGWAWLSVTCQQCRHKRDLRFEDLIRDGRPGALGALARKLYCGKCRGRSLQFALGAYIDRSGQPWAEHRPIAFSGNATVRPSRE